MTSQNRGVAVIAPPGICGLCLDGATSHNHWPSRREAPSSQRNRDIGTAAQRPDASRGQQAEQRQRNAGQHPGDGQLYRRAGQHTGQRALHIADTQPVVHLASQADRHHNNDTAVCLPFGASPTMSNRMMLALPHKGDRARVSGG